MKNDSNDRKAGSIARIFAGLACLLLLVLAVCFFPVDGGISDLWTPFMYLTGVFFTGRFAITGRKFWWSWEQPKF
ncbi:MAG: hypothetical protein NTY53_05680 [Kiritimatiellaeota bacterium]|nr:hypothetical protein [Kiritimatiellota bacterium]